ncbi:glycosyltransferase [bacterium]|nr:glycosyltransferase [bacterium]
MPTISIVIPTRNGGTRFQKVLESLRHQTISANAEILVIDSKSTDDTPNIATQWGANVISIDPTSFNHGYTRNVGIENTSGEFIILLTQDALPANTHFIKSLLHAMQEFQAAGVHAKQIPLADASPLAKHHVRTWVSGQGDRMIKQIKSPQQLFPLPPSQQHLYCVFENVAGMVRREVWEKIPFPETPFGEDLDWGFRVICNGYTLVYEPNAVVEHSHERSPAYTYWRTFIDHYKLFDLFGLRTIPTKPKILRSFLLSTMSDWGVLFRHPEFRIKWLKDMIHAPAHAWASSWGQYRGAKTSANGTPIEKIQGV